MRSVWDFSSDVFITSSGGVNSGSMQQSGSQVILNTSANPLSSSLKERAGGLQNGTVKAGIWITLKCCRGDQIFCCTLEKNVSLKRLEMKEAVHKRWQVDDRVTERWTIYAERPHGLTSAKKGRNKLFEFFLEKTVPCSSGVLWAACVWLCSAPQGRVLSAETRCA